MTQPQFKMLMPPGSDAELLARYDYIPSCIIVADFDGTIAIRIRIHDLVNDQDHLANGSVGKIANLYLDRVDAKTQSPGDMLSPEQFNDMANLPGKPLILLFSTRGAEPNDVIAETVGKDAQLPIISWNEASYAELLLSHFDTLNDDNQIDADNAIDSQNSAYFIDAWKVRSLRILARYVEYMFGMSVMWVDNASTGFEFEEDAGRMRVHAIPVDSDEGITRDTVRHMREAIDANTAQDGDARWASAYQILKGLQRVANLEELPPHLDPDYIPEPGEFVQESLPGMGNVLGPPASGRLSMGQVAKQAIRARHPAAIAAADAEEQARTEVAAAHPTLDAGLMEPATPAPYEFGI